MSDANFAILIDFAAGGLVLAAVLIVWRRDLPAIVGLLAWQGVALAAVPLVRGVHEDDAALIVVGMAVLVLRAIVLPWLLARAVGAEPREQREAAPLINTATSLLRGAIRPGAVTLQSRRRAAAVHRRRPGRGGRTDPG